MQKALAPTRNCSAPQNDCCKRSGTARMRFEPESRCWPLSKPSSRTIPPGNDLVLYVFAYPQGYPHLFRLSLVLQGFPAVCRLLDTPDSRPLSLVSPSRASTLSLTRETRKSPAPRPPHGGLGVSPHVLIHGVSKGGRSTGEPAEPTGTNCGGFALIQRVKEKAAKGRGASFTGRRQ
jgi:hypothetical protein